MTTSAHGISVSVKSQWLPEQSSPRRFAFSYTVTIENGGDGEVTLLGRHWVISDGNGRVEHVRGPGVVGYQPKLSVGQAFTYTSGAILEAEHGTMAGKYHMVRADDGSTFDVEIPPFALIVPSQIQ